MTLTLPLCVVIVYLIQKVYLRTSRQLRLLDLESQSAVYSSFLESVCDTPAFMSVSSFLTVTIIGRRSCDYPGVRLGEASRAGKYPQSRQIPTACLRTLLSSAVAENRP